MTIQTYHIHNGTKVPQIYRIKVGSRMFDSLEALRRGPLQAASPIRRSEHIRQFRKAGMVIETEMRDQYAREGRYGVYHLRSKVTPENGGAA